MNFSTTKTYPNLTELMSVLSIYRKVMDRETENVPRKKNFVSHIKRYFYKRAGTGIFTNLRSET